MKEGKESNSKYAISLDEDLLIICAIN